MKRFLGIVAISALAASCQTYDFERVVPLAVAQTTQTRSITAKQLKPNVMMVVDNSGSMEYPTNTSNPNCPSNCGTAGNTKCPPTCPTRISELKSAMGVFLQTSATIARLGLTVYPAGGGTLQCQGSSNIDVQLPSPTSTDDGTNAALTDTANQVNARIQSLIPSGGTPTGASLEFVGTYSGLNDPNDGRDDFVLLLTDGLPNCNTGNANSLCSCGNTCSAAQVSACNCTTSTCGTGLCSLGCLDQDNTVSKVTALKAKNIRTIVVGFGAELATGTGQTVLNAMAREGGFARECPMGTDAECGGMAGSCNTFTKACTTSFFQASNGTELAAALRKISESFIGDPCVFKLDERPSDPAYLSVIVNGASLQAGPDTYSYVIADNTVQFAGATCRQLTGSTPQNPVKVEFRVVQRF